jgi:diketogulonate reductase-like aldo/keto reductase
MFWADTCRVMCLIFCKNTSNLASFKSNFSDMNLQIPSVQLNNGKSMPTLGLGVYAPEQKQEVGQAVEAALSVGYRLFDAAAIYGNEIEVGQALNQGGVSRKELFVTSKVWMDDMGYDSTMRAFEKSLKDLALDYLDLYLIHWPKDQHRKETWKALESLHEQGVVHSIGVSNYYQKHLEELFVYAHVCPAVNQIELSPFCYLPEELAFCKQNNIQVEGYAPVVRGLKKEHPVLVDIARKWSKSTYQILIRWVIEQGAVTIPKSINPERMIENAEVFDFALDAEDMARLAVLYDNTRVAWDPRDF